MSRSKFTPHQKAISIEMARMVKEACPAFAADEPVFSYSLTEDAAHCAKLAGQRVNKLQIVCKLLGREAPAFAAASYNELCRLQMLAALTAIAMASDREADKTTEKFLEMLPSFFDQARLMGASLEEEYEAAKRSSPGAPS